MRPSSLTEEQLAIRLRSGDMQALHALYERWKEGLFRFAARLVSDGAAAEDIVHDAFVTMFDARQQLTDPGALRSWTYTVVRNNAYTFLNKEKRLKPLDEGDDAEFFDDAEADSALELGERDRQIETLLAALPPHYREVLLLREFEGMQYEEIAAVTGSSVSAVKSRLFKARRVLMKRMEPLRRRNDL